MPEPTVGEIHQAMLEAVDTIRQITGRFEALAEALPECPEVDAVNLRGEIVLPEPYLKGALESISYELGKQARELEETAADTQGNLFPQSQA